MTRSSQPRPAGARGLLTPRRRRGSLLLLMPFVLVMLLAVSVLAVDWGRLQVVRGELQAAADAAVLHAASGVRDGTAADRAMASVSDNRANGLPITLQHSDIRIGQWDDGTRQLLDRDPPDAVQITLKAEVRPFFGRLVGRELVELSATAVGATSQSTWGLVGIDSVTMEGVSRLDSYQPRLGSYAQTRRDKAVISSNGTIWISPNATIAGDAYPGINAPIEAAGTVTGRWRRQDEPLYFPEVTSAEWEGRHNNAALREYLNGPGDFTLGAKERLDLPAGKYVVRDFTMVGGSLLDADGPVTIFVTGSVDIAGRIRTDANLPSNLQIRVASNGPVRLAGSSNFYGHVYAPLSEIDIAGTADYYGSFIGRTLIMRGTVDVHHDESLTVNRSGDNLLVR